MDKYIGKMLDDRYEIIELIGSGGMANVYKAKCHRLNRMVAIKILKTDMAENEEIRRRFRQGQQPISGARFQQSIRQVITPKQLLRVPMKIRFPQALHEAHARCMDDALQAFIELPLPHVLHPPR